jgi:hypothetical protein
MESAKELEQIVLQESYVLDVHQVGSDVVFTMDLLLDTGRTKVGRIIFPAVETEEWLSDKGEPTSLQGINAVAHRYFGGPDEKPDLGTINFIHHESNYWYLSGDWGSCNLFSAGCGDNFQRFSAAGWRGVRASSLERGHIG